MKGESSNGVGLVLTDFVSRFSSGSRVQGGVQRCADFFCLHFEVNHSGMVLVNK